jgi:hypothetical protein
MNGPINLCLFCVSVSGIESKVLIEKASHALVEGHKT